MIALLAQILLLAWTFVVCPVMAFGATSALPIQTDEEGGLVLVLAYVALWFWPALSLIVVYLLALIAERVEAIREIAQEQAAAD